MQLLLRLKLIGLFLFVSNVSAKEIIIEPGPNAYDEVQEAMILMDEGDTLILKSGNYWFEDGLSLDGLPELSDSAAKSLAKIDPDRLFLDDFLEEQVDKYR